IGTLALFTTGPWAVYFTRKIWTPDTLPFFSAAVFALLALALIGRKRWVLPAALLVLGLELQIHLEALAVLPAIFLVLVVFYRRVRLGELLLGLVLLALTGVPYLWHSVQTGFADFKMLTSASTQAAAIDLRSVELLNSLISGAGYPAGLGVVLPDDTVQWTIPFVGELLVVAMWLGMALATYEAIRQARKGKLDTGAAVGLMAVLWCVVPLLATLRHSFPLYLRYELFILPIPFVFPALFLVRLGAWLRAGLNRVGSQSAGSPAPAMAVAVPAVLLVFAGVGGALNFESVNRITSANGVYVLPGHGPMDAYSAPYIRDSREAMTRLETVARPDIDTLVIGPVQRGPLEYLNDSRYRLRFIDAPDMLVLPGTPCQMIFLADSSAVADLALQAGATERTDLNLTWPPDNRKARILEYDPAKLNLKDEFTAVESGQVIPNGLELVAYKVDNNTGKQFDLLTVWRVAREDWAHRFWLYNSFTHIFAPNGQQLDVSGETELSTSSNWRKDDLLIIPSTVIAKEEIPRGAYRIDMGVYVRFPARTPIPVEAGAKEVASFSSVRLGKQVSEPAAGEAVATLDSAIRLVQAQARLADDGKSVQLSLVWQATKKLDRDYTIFAHLYDSGGNLVDQIDGWPANGNYPTSAWAADELVPDERAIPLTATLGEGEYTVKVGMYDAKTMERLAPTPETADRAVVVGKLTVKSQ
ncbi:MAG: hypothetical protein ACYC1C_00575, partial [Chloroflexota bacterium]